MATKLNENGIIRFDQIARLSPNEVAILEDRLGPFKGRLTRDRVVEQASYLARGDKDGFRSEEHTSELQSLMRHSYAAFFLKKKNRMISLNTKAHINNKTV